MTDTPGLKWRKRTTGPPIPYWIAPRQAIKAGFKIKSWNLSRCPPEDIPGRCQRMYAEALAFASKYKASIPYDGTIASLINLYQVHPDSPFQRLSATSLRTYSGYASRLAKQYGERRIADLTGLDVMRWHKTWRTPHGNNYESAGYNPIPGSRPLPRSGCKSALPRQETVAAAAMALNVLKAALSFGNTCGFRDCAVFRGMISNLRLPAPKPREEAPDAQDVRLAMEAAVALGCPSAALAYALQFETAARQYDIVGQWVPLMAAHPSGFIAGGKKWIGPTWAAIDADMILTLTPSKTERTTGKRVRIDLKLCPMVMEAISTIERRAGPLIVDDRTGEPFWARQFERLWGKVRAAAGLRPTLWNRDLRAGGLTEGSMAGASSDDRAKLAGHSQKISQRVYDRDVLVSSSRVNEARAKFRERKE
ncbi:MAG: integrase [Chloroflexi bacterium]|nr:MAG: integrase [Chloroflexota bacterium]